MQLVQQIMDSVGVSQEQAEGGAGLIMDFVKGKIGDAKFGELTQSVPEATDLAGKSPQPEPNEGGGVASMLFSVTSSVGGALGGVTGGLGGLADLAAGFNKLGLDASQIGEYADTILAFVEDKAGKQARELLEGVLK